MVIVLAIVIFLGLGFYFFCVFSFRFFKKIFFDIDSQDYSNSIANQILRNFFNKYIDE